MTFAIRNDRNQLVLNTHQERGCIMIETGGGGITMLLERRQMLELAGALIQSAFTLNSVKHHLTEGEA